jgi:transcriptional regulator with XRE-family HTH domain
MATPKDLPQDIGGFIRDLRQTAKISLRQLAERAGVSNPYLSQIERGLRKPSAEVLQQLASALRVSTPAMYLRAGLLDSEGQQGVLAAIAVDPELTIGQKQSLTQIYETFRHENARHSPSDTAEDATVVDGTAEDAMVVDATADEATVLAATADEAATVVDATADEAATVVDATADEATAEDAAGDLAVGDVGSGRKPRGPNAGRNAGQGPSDAANDELVAVLEDVAVVEDGAAPSPKTRKTTEEKK